MSQGVVIPQGQLRSAERRVENKVFNAMPAEVVAVEYTNDHGEVIKDIWYKFGDQFYVHPDGETFTGALKSVKESYNAQALERYNANAVRINPAAAIPKEDSVDIVSQEIIDEAK